MAKRAFVKISGYRKKFEVTIQWEVQQHFFFPLIGSNMPLNYPGNWFYSMNTRHVPQLDPDDDGYRLFTISHQNGDLIFKSGYSHEFTQDGVVVHIDGAGDSYLINFGFLNN